MSDHITRAIQTYADNHSAAIERLIRAVRANDDAAIDAALLVLKAQIEADGVRFGTAIVNTVQAIVSRHDEKLDTLMDTVQAVARRQEEVSSEVREGLRGISHDIAEEVRAALTPETHVHDE